jgi:TPR repeat protein
MKIQSILLTLLLTIGFTSISYADFAEGVKHYKNKEYKLAYDEWLPLAKNGNISAQSQIGALYENGHGVKKNNEQAVKWYRKAAEQGLNHAQFNLGWMYANGKGLIEDYKEAVKWYKKSATQGNILAQYNLGTLYDKDIILDPQKAVDWYEKAAHQGSPEAQYYLALHYILGTGVLQDYYRAKYWLELAHAGDNLEIRKKAEGAWNLKMLWKYR